MSLHKVDFETVSREFPPRICTASYITMNKLLRQTPGRPCLEATVNRDYTIWAIGRVHRAR